MAPNGVNGSDPNGVSGWKHYNEGTFLFTVSFRASDMRFPGADEPRIVRVCR